MTTTTQTSRPYLQGDLGKLGERLIRFGQALQNPDTTMGQLSSLAGACGIKLNMRAVAETEADHEQPR